MRRAGPGLSPKEAAKSFAEWQTEYNRISDKLEEARKTGETTDRKLMSEYQKHYQKRGEFMQDERTGFVWLYVRK